jgi:hypothetical protein
MTTPGVVRCACRLAHLRRPAAATLGQDNWVWAPTGMVDIHQPELWGHLSRGP